MRYVCFALFLAGCEQDYTVNPTPPDVDPADITECGFTRVESTVYYRYDCNPVFTSTGEDWLDQIGSTAFNVTEVVGHPFYQLWYTGLIDDGSDFSPYAMGYAASPDGTAFSASGDNPVLDQGEPAEFDSDYMSGNQVVWDPDTAQYVMIWQGIHDDANPEKIVNGLGVATSADGRTWSRLGKNPVFDFGYDDAGNVNYCWPLDLTLGEVSGYTGYVAGSSDGDSVCEVYELNASGLADWKASDAVVLPAGDKGEWDATGVINMSIAQLGGTRFLFYVGFEKWTRQGNYVLATNSKLGVATYDDDRGRWVKEPNPLPLNLTEEGNVTGVEALRVGKRIHLWITDQYEVNGEAQHAIGYFLYDPEFAAAEDAEGG
jgi:hypothetical protein